MSVVIPAHNEATVIGRLLELLIAGARSGQLEVIVSANGCSDGTAAVARAFGSCITVLETEVASKVAALNAADQQAVVFPRAYVDADVEVDLESLLAVADLLDDPRGPLVAAPALRVDVARSSWAVCAHYRIWELTNYRHHQHVGSGIYALSYQGRQRFGLFPEVISDDLFIQQLFSPAERGTGPRGHFTVHAPTNLRALIHRSTRAAAGIAQMRSAGVPAHPESEESSSVQALLSRVALRPQLWAAFTVYCLGYLAPRIMARRKIAAGLLHVWERDETSRR